MTVGGKVVWIVALVLVAILGFVAYQWFQEYDAKIRAEATTTVMENRVNVNMQDIDQAKKEFETATADRERIIQTLQQELAMIEAQRAVVPAPQQFVVDASKLIPNLPAPLKVQDVPATGDRPATQEVVIPREDLAALHNYRLDCEEKGIRLDACEQSASNDAAKILSLNTQAVKAQDNYDLMEKDRNNWRNTAKGGTVMKRALTAGKWIVIGGAVGYVASRAVH